MGNPMTRGNGSPPVGRRSSGASRSLNALLFGCLLFAVEGRAAVDTERLADAERAFQDARAAVDAGDIEGGIVALERLLLLSPGLGNIQFELGLLYARVGADDRARFYLDESLKDDSMPPEVRRRAEVEITRMDESASPHDFSGLAALRVQSDTNPGADSARQQFVDLVAGPMEGDSDESAEQDTSLHGTVDAGYRYRIDGRSGWSVGGGVSMSAYGDQDDLDEQRLFLRTGYDYRMREREGDVERIDFVPQLLYAATRRDGEQYGDTLGIALGARASTRRSSRGVTLRVSEVGFDEPSNARREGTRFFRRRLLRNGDQLGHLRPFRVRHGS